MKKTLIAFFALLIILTSGCFWIIPGSPEDPTVDRTFSSGYVDSYIDGNTVLEIPITVSYNGTVKSVESVQIKNIQHYPARDLLIRLKSPSGKVVDIMNTHGGYNDLSGDYKFYSNDSSFPNVSEMVENTSGGIIYEGIYNSDQPFDSFSGENTEGSWSLIIWNHGSYIGAIDEVKLSLVMY